MEKPTILFLALALTVSQIAHANKNITGEEIMTRGELKAELFIEELELRKPIRKCALMAGVILRIADMKDGGFAADKAREKIEEWLQKSNSSQKINRIIRETVEKVYKTSSGGDELGRHSFKRCISLFIQTDID